MQQTIELASRHAGARRPAEPDARRWVAVLAPYRESSPGRSLAELLVTVVPFVALWLAMLLSLRYSYWLCLLFAVPAAGLLVRLFMIQHDCGHGSFFHRRRANDWLGRALGVLTLTPYGYWRRTHAMHHGTSGHLDRRGTGDIGTLTVREYQSQPTWRRALYRLKRHPIVVLGLGPFYLFVLKHRLPVRLMRAGRAPWLSTMSTNLAIAVVIGLLVLPGSARLSSGAGADHLACLVGRRLAVLRAAPVRAHLLRGRGLERPHRSPARQLTICRPCCAGSRPTSASITSTTSRAESPSTGSTRRCARIPSSRESVACRSWRASAACVSPCGTRISSDWRLSAMPALPSVGNRHGHHSKYDEK
jgi:hypothetical protein